MVILNGYFHNETMKNGKMLQKWNTKASFSQKCMPGICKQFVALSGFIYIDCIFFVIVVLLYDFKENKKKADVGKDRETLDHYFIHYRWVMNHA